MDKDNEKYTLPAEGDALPGTGDKDHNWEVSVSSAYGERPTTTDGEVPVDSPPAELPAYGSAGRTVFPAWLNILAIIGVLVASMYIGQLAGYIAGRGGDTGEGFPRFITYLIWFGITIGFAWWITVKRGTVRRPFSFSLGKTNPTLILWGLILVIVTSMVLTPLLDLFPQENMERLRSAVGTGGWAMLVTIVMVPILEEVLFRGLIQQELVNGYGRIKGVLMAAAVFGIVHFIPQQVINAFFIGIILGYLYIRSGSLTAAILIHAINNAIAYITMQLFGDKFEFTRSVFGGDVWYWTVYGICCAIFLVAGWRLLRELRKLDLVAAETGPAE